MPSNHVGEEMILDELHELPMERWDDVLTFIRALRDGSQLAMADRLIVCGTDLAGSELIGIWANRIEITDSREFARQLRQQAEHRRGTTDAAGH